MPWIGKIIVGAAAFLLTSGMPGLGRIFIIVLGVVWGHQFDKARAAQGSGQPLARRIQRCAA